MIMGKMYEVNPEDLSPNQTQFMVPKPIARITICGAFNIIVTDMDDWIPPTEEQRKILKICFALMWRYFNTVQAILIPFSCAVDKITPRQ